MLCNFFGEIDFCIGMELTLTVSVSSSVTSTQKRFAFSSFLHPAIGNAKKISHTITVLCIILTVSFSSQEAESVLRRPVGRPHTASRIQAMTYELRVPVQLFTNRHFPYDLRPTTVPACWCTNIPPFPRGIQVPNAPMHDCPLARYHVLFQSHPLTSSMAHGRANPQWRSPPVQGSQFSPPSSPQRSPILPSVVR